MLICQHLDYSHSPNKVQNGTNKFMHVYLEVFKIFLLRICLKI